MATMTAIQRHHLGRNLLLTQKLWEYCEEPVEGLSQQLPGLLKHGLKRINVQVQGIKRYSEKTLEDAAYLIDVIAFAFHTSSEKLPDSNGIHLQVSLEVLHALLLDMLPIYPAIKQEPAMTDLFTLVEKLTKWLDNVRPVSEGPEVSAAVAFIQKALYDAVLRLDKEEIFWFKGKFYPDMDKWTLAVQGKPVKRTAKGKGN